jgi:hypothetical protein
LQFQIVLSLKPYLDAKKLADEQAKKGIMLNLNKTYNFVFRRSKEARRAKESRRFATLNSFCY